MKISPTVKEAWNARILTAIALQKKKKKKKHTHTHPVPLLLFTANHDHVLSDKEQM